MLDRKTVDVLTALNAFPMFSLCVLRDVRLKKKKKNLCNGEYLNTTS